MPLRVAFVKTSLIDFPGRVSSVLFLPGCDFACPYCHNAPLVRGSEADLVPIEEFYAHLERRAHLISGVVLTGGEPLANADSARIAEAIRGRGLALKLDTNGSFPDRLAAILDPSSTARPDYVALDIKTAPSAYRRVSPRLPNAGESVLQSLRSLRSSGIPFEIRITCAPGIVGEDEMRELSLALEADDAVFLQAFRPGSCLDPAWDEVEPYSRSEMEALLDIVREKARGAAIRGG
jgi:anaerobic ribonucleoside-triphosphate reductase activating protein